MKKNTSFLWLGTCSVLLLSACGASVSEKEIIENGQFWQRVHTSEAVYMRGPKAQQLLNRDISRCVTELRELERLGSLKGAIPTDTKGRILDPDQMAIESQDAPDRDQYLFAEHKDFNDFETCMLSKGWERVMYVPYDEAYDSSKTYINSHVELSKMKRDIEERRANPERDFTDLNE